MNGSGWASSRVVDNDDDGECACCLLCTRARGASVLLLPTHGSLTKLYLRTGSGQNVGSPSWSSSPSFRRRPACVFKQAP